jgi:hypothetical protein
MRRRTSSKKFNANLKKGPGARLSCTERIALGGVTRHHDAIVAAEEEQLVRGA